MESASLVEALGGAAALEPNALAALEANPPLPVAIACSGGPDSVAAAIIVRELFPTRPLTLLHFNHRLRGRDSDKDAEFVRALAQKLNADFRLGIWENPDKKNEVAARDARMNFLRQWEHEIIIFGHHADDAAETFLMRLARGASLEGLCAPHAVNRVHGHTHLRPLLTLRKTQILDALKAARIPFRTDRTNAHCDYLRNRIRNKLLPLWQKLETRDIVAGILASQGQLRELRRVLGPLQTRSVCESPAEEASTDNDVFFECSSAGLPAPERAQAAPPHSLIPGTTLFLPSGASLSAKRVPAPAPEFLKSHSDPLRLVWVADAPLFVRGWAQGERYTPLGAPGSRKMKELLNENCAAFRPNVRANWPLICDADGHPLWLPGCRITANAAVAASATHAIELKFFPPALTVAQETS